MRTKFGVVLSIIIGGALLAFIFSLKNDMGFSGNDPKVGEIAGDKIHYQEFLAAYDNVKAQMGDKAQTEEQSMQLLSATWQSLMADHVLLPGFENSGIAVTADEFKAMVAGEKTSSIFASQFTDPRTGIYNVEAVKEFLAQVQTNPQAQQMWNMMTRQAKLERQISKYLALVRGGAYVNKLELDNALAAANNTFAGDYVCLNYNTIADSTIVVSNSDIKKYYKSHINNYKQNPYCSISYVAFDIDPTDADKEQIENEAKKAGEEFAATADVKAYGRDNHHVSIADTYVSLAQMAGEEGTALSAGKTYGPVLTGNEWRATRVVDSRNVADTLTLSHIVLPYSDSEKADSLLNAAKSGADFAELAKNNSLAETSVEGGKIGKIPYAVLQGEFADALNGAKVGDIVKVNMGNIIQIVKVDGLGKIQKHAKIATLTYNVEPSAATLRAVHSAASTFAVAANGSVEKFNETAAAQSMTPRTAKIGRGERAINGIDEQSLEVIRWANEAKVGAVSDIFNLGKTIIVAAVTAINDNEFQTLDEVAPMIKNVLIRDKKFEQLSAKLAGATLEEVAKANSTEVKNFEDVTYTAYYIKGIGVDPALIGAITAVNQDKVNSISAPVKGMSGAYIFTIKNITTLEEPQTLEAERVKALSQAQEMAARRALYAVQERAEVVDNTVKFF